MKIAINGAGVAGPTLAYWLRRYGHEPVLIEVAPRLRTGGYVIDCWGTGYDVVEKMGLLPMLREQAYNVGEWRLVDGEGHRTGGISTSTLNHLTHGRAMTLQRGALASTIYGAVSNDVETIFGDSVAAIEENGDGVRVSFDRHPARDFDLVIGADGLHSRVREIAFGPESAFEIGLGYHVAAFEVTGYRPRDELAYVSHNVPGRQISRFALRNDKTIFLLVFDTALMGGRSPSTPGERKAVLRDVFGGVAWEAPQILAAMEADDDIYFDRVSQIRMEQWWKGRAALIGDAAAAVSLLAGEGTGLGMAEAYVLAGELSAAADDHATGFRRYAEVIGAFVRRKQDNAKAMAASMVPKSALRIKLRDVATRLMAIPFLADYFIGRDMRESIDLPDYSKWLAR
ncbi:FAD-binding domain [Bradyrhizobium sp. LHD-71]|uniref:FAD-binding domain n=1 Tax=Bradyrhizobium sp. LHD-71 TaxID=3072141 RepID=UPI00280D3CCC|nr:FAD-binding domain [Bradyrhizobium sp. LHD-71]MDQ8730208.1 FAD-binding domain [Bradyrhizobium sp. LHD-71]